jgi:hypothetical protein
MGIDLPIKLVAGGVPVLLCAWPVGAKAAEGPNSASNALGVGPEDPTGAGLVAVLPSPLGFLKNGFVEDIVLAAGLTTSLV